MWTKKQRREITVNATLQNTRKSPLQSTIVHTRKITQRTTPSEQSQTWIKAKLLQQKKDKPKNIGPPQATIARPCPKVKPVRFDDPYDHIHHMDHNHENTHLIDTQEQDMKKMSPNKMNYMTRKMMT